MANVTISNLTLYTGDTDGSYIVMNDSTETTTYKVKKESFILPNKNFSQPFGIYTQTATTGNISGTTVQSIIGDGVGTLTIPANGFSIGDTFRASIRGHLSNGNNSLRFKVSAGAVTLTDSGSINYNTAGEEYLMDLDIDFLIIKVGGAGTAEILTKGRLRTIKNSNFTVNGYSFETHNTTTFDTTVSNELDITIQFNATASDTYVYTDFFTLSKVY